MDMRVASWRRLSAEELMLELWLRELMLWENWCFERIDALNCDFGQGSWESLGNPKGNQSWILIGGTDDEAEAPILWPPDEQSLLIGKDPDAGNDWKWEEKGMTEDEMVGWHHWLDGYEAEQAPGDGEGQGSLACCSPCGHKESDRTKQFCQ